MNFYRGTPINAHATSASFNSSPIESVAPSFMFKFSAIANASHSSAGGTLQLQGSNTAPNAEESYTWANVGTAKTIAGVTAVIIEAIDVCYARLRFVYSDTTSGSSTALLTAETMSFTF